MSVGGDKVALVTGSTSGIGLKTVTALAKRGINLIINGFGDEALINRILADLKSHGVRADYIAADVGKVAEVDALWAKVIELYPDGIDILVNNAGFQHLQRVEEYPDEMWDTVIASNLTATFQLTKRAVPGMKKKGWGRIVNMASVRAFGAMPTAAPYSAAKAGVVGLTKGVALENAQFGITCNAVCPALVLTPPIEQRIAELKAQRGDMSFEEAEAILTETTPTRKLIKPEQIAEMVEFLCLSGASSQMTGAAYYVDGGFLAQ